MTSPIATQRVWIVHTIVSATAGIYEEPLCTDEALHEAIIKSVLLGRRELVVHSEGLQGAVMHCSSDKK